MAAMNRRKLAQFFNWRVPPTGFRRTSHCKGWALLKICRSEVSVTLTDGRVLVGVLMAVDRPQLVFVPCVAAAAVKYLSGM